ncbi:MAG: DUF309 domain-containing protein [Candidatus Wallbacteria bacterium]|nr:DUF309 domain-containing protein [Candidatus Wallbacteria bacterium]
MTSRVDEAELPDLDPRVLEGIELFNREEFFEAHEAIESAWLEEFGQIRPLYQGLIQAAVALHHVGQSNRHGAIKLYHTSRAYLLPFGDVCKGIRVGALVRDLDHLFTPVLAGGSLPHGPMPRIGVETRRAIGAPGHPG